MFGSRRSIGRWTRTTHSAPDYAAHNNAWTVGVPLHGLCVLSPRRPAAGHSMTDLRSGVGRNVTLDIALVTGYALVATLLIVTEAISGATRVAVAAPLVGFLPGYALLSTLVPATDGGEGGSVTTSRLQSPDWRGSNGVRCRSPRRSGYSRSSPSRCPRLISPHE